jgi:cell division protein ZapA
MEQLTVRILDRDSRLSCEPAERDGLMAAVAHVDRSMHAIREQGKIAGAERIAVLAALNIASDLLARGPSTPTVDAIPAATAEEAVADEEILRRMRSINALLDTALADQERLF